MIAIAVFAVTRAPLQNFFAMLGKTFAAAAAPTATAAAATTLASTAASVGSVVGAGVAGASASVVSQGIGVATGIQEKFSWNAVALSAIGAGVGASSLAHLTASPAANAMIASAASQGIGVATGLQKEFSWASVAAAGVSRLAGARFGANTVGGATASLLANAATRTLIDGSDFGDNMLAALPDMFAQLAMMSPTAQSGAADKPFMSLGKTGVLDAAKSNSRPGHRAWWEHLWGGVSDFFGDLLGFDEGRFSLGDIGLNESNAAAVNEAWDGVITVTAPVRRAVDDFVEGWNTTPALPRREETLSAAPAYIPVVSEWQYRQGYASYTASLADGMRGQRSIFNSPFQNFGLDARAAMYNIESVFQRPAALRAPIDATLGRGIEAAHPHMDRYGSTNALATSAMALLGNPEVMAARLGPRGVLTAETATATDLQLALQRATDQAVARLAQNPEIAVTILKPAEYAQLSRRGPAAHMQYGNAVERLTARIIAADPELSEVLTHIGPVRGANGRYLSAPDFFAHDELGVAYFDITTSNQIASHSMKWYDPYTHYATHPGLSPYLVFPK